MEIFILIILLFQESLRPKRTINDAMQMYITIKSFDFQDDIDLYILSELNYMAFKNM